MARADAYLQAAGNMTLGDVDIRASDNLPAPGRSEGFLAIAGGRGVLVSFEPRCYDIEIDLPEQGRCGRARP